MRAALATLLLLCSAPAAALAGEVIPTAPADAPLPAAAPVAPLADAAGGADADGPVAQRPGPCGPEAVKADGQVETKPHGYVEAGIGTSGYRHIGAGFCKPFKNGGAVAVSVSESQIDDRRVRDR